MACQLCTRPTAGRLCTPCGTRLGRHLADLPPLYAALAAYLRPSAQAADRLGTRPTTPADAPLPVDLDVLDLIGPGGAVTVLETWRQALHEDLELHWPDPWGHPDGRLLRATRGLHQHLTYIRLDWPAAGDCAREVHQLHAAATRHVAPTDRPTDRPTVVGHHPDPARPGDAPCGGRLELPRGSSALRCARCHETWGPLQWLTLRRALERARARAADQPAA
ncbi:hypothetical protein ACFXAF_12450 [Kitasatospora sp. NPDC059463]|uniref:zinc finger domain-containing protein n=1 Tax=unclassified Kitasatospora TaxID=2633591 RepID=UPI00369D527B